MQNDVEQRVKAIIAKNLDVAAGDVRAESEFVKDLGADSLAIVELVASDTGDRWLLDIGHFSGVGASSVSFPRATARPVDPRIDARPFSRAACPFSTATTR